jgi:hypothetical protein
VNLVQPGVVIPPGAHLLGNGTPVIDREVLLRAVRETATIVRPGEMLIIRMPVNMPDPVFAQYAQQVTATLQQAGVRAMVLRADQLAVAETPQPEPVETQPAAAWAPSTPPVKYGSSSPARPEPDYATIDREPYEPGPAG